MKLLTKEIEKRLPRLYSQENVSDPVVHAKFFTPDSSWTWFVTEASEEPNAPPVLSGTLRAVQSHPEVLFFGYVIGLEKEWGYFTLSELMKYRSRFGLGIERDMYFKPGPFSEVLVRYNKERGR